MENNLEAQSSKENSFFHVEDLLKSLPTFDNLFKRNCSNTNRCMICHTKAETFSHLFCQCPWVTKVWHASPFTFKIPIDPDFNMHQWLIEGLTGLNFNDWEKSFLCTLLWQIWKCRNSFVYNKTPTDISFVLSQAGKSLTEFRDANSLFKNPSSEVAHSGFSTSLKKWKPPDLDWLKINTDATFNEENEEVAIAFAVRDTLGWLLDGSSQIVPSSSSLHVEFLALEVAVLFANENELHNIFFKTNCQILVNHPTLAYSIPDWTCDVIIDNIRTSGAFIRNHSFKWIPHEANVVANWIEIGRAHV